MKLGYILLLASAILTSGCAHRMAPTTIQVSQSPHQSVFTDYTINPGDIIEAVYIFGGDPVAQYKLHLGDLISIRFPSQPQLDIEQRVRPDGMITLPHIFDIYVEGLTPPEAVERIRKAYAKTMRNHEMDFFVLDSGSDSEELRQVIRTDNMGQSKRLLVRPDGRVGLPGIGDFVAIGKTIPALNKAVNDRYKERWPDVMVNILLEETAGAKLYVLGEVARDGEYGITRPMTVPQALALAGGRTELADDGFVYIARFHDSEYSVTSHKINEGFIMDDGTIPILSANDILYIPRSGLAEASIVMRQLSQAIMFQGWGFNFSYRVDDK